MGGEAFELFILSQPLPPLVMFELLILLLPLGCDADVVFERWDEDDAVVDGDDFDAELRLLAMEWLLLWLLVPFTPQLLLLAFFRSFLS